VGGPDRSRDVVAQKWPETAGARRKLAENGQIVQRAPASRRAFAWHVPCWRHTACDLLEEVKSRQFVQAFGPDRTV